MTLLVTAVRMNFVILSSGLWTTPFSKLYDKYTAQHFQACFRQGPDVRPTTIIYV